MQDLAHASAARTTQERKPEARLAQPSDVRGSDVLLASPDAEAGRACASELGERGFHVHLARTGFEAIVKATCHLPGVILLDDALGPEAADETTRLLAGCPITSHIPVVRVTSRRGMPARLLRTLAAAAAL